MTYVEFTQLGGVQVRFRFPSISWFQVSLGLLCKKYADVGDLCCNAGRVFVSYSDTSTVDLISGIT